jgi:hypothetical protein
VQPSEPIRPEEGTGVFAGHVADFFVEKGLLGERATATHP